MTAATAGAQSEAPGTRHAGELASTEAPATALGARVGRAGQLSSAASTPRRPRPPLRFPCPSNNTPQVCGGRGPVPGTTGAPRDCVQLPTARGGSPRRSMEPATPACHTPPSPCVPLCLVCPLRPAARTTGLSRVTTQPMGRSEAGSSGPEPASLPHGAALVAEPSPESGPSGAAREGPCPAQQVPGARPADTEPRALRGVGK